MTSKLSKIYFSSPQAQFKASEAEILEAISRVCNSSSYVLGPEVKGFEEEFARYNGSSFSLGVGSGTDALILGLKSLGIGLGDEVITVAHTALATIAAIIATGATPVLVDIEEDFYTLDPSHLELALSNKTKAIIPVHLYGQPCDMDLIMDFSREHNLNVIEDCAQAHGAEYKGKKVGTFGDMGCFSFYPTKNLGAIGDGGAIITKDEKIKNKIDCLRQYGWDASRVAQDISTVSRLDELQAAILSVKLKKLDQDIEERKKIAERYQKEINEKILTAPEVREGSSSVYHVYVGRTPKRDELMSVLRSQNIFPGIHYPEAVHHHPGYKNRVKVAPQGLSTTEKILSEIVTLPLYPGLSPEDQDRVIQAVNEVGS